MCSQFFLGHTNAILSGTYTLYPQGLNFRIIHIAILRVLLLETHAISSGPYLQDDHDASLGPTFRIIQLLLQHPKGSIFWTYTCNPSGHTFWIKQVRSSRLYFLDHMRFSRSYFQDHTCHTFWTIQMRFSRSYFQDHTHAILQVYTDANPSGPTFRIIQMLPQDPKSPYPSGHTLRVIQMLCFRSYLLDLTDDILKVILLGSYTCNASGPTFRIIMLLSFRSYFLDHTHAILKVILFGSYTCYSFGLYS